MGSCPPLLLEKNKKTKTYSIGYDMGGEGSGFDMVIFRRYGDLIVATDYFGLFLVSTERKYF